MIIGIDASRANRFPRSGVEWYAFNLIKELYRLDTSNRYFLYTPSKLSEDLQPTTVNFEEKILNWPFKRFWTLGRMGLEMFFHKPDILFVPSHTFPLVGGKKNIITWHDIGYERYPENYSHWDLASLKQGIKNALKMADKIVSVSEFTKSEMVRIYEIDPDRIRVIHLGCDHQFWRPIEPDQVKEFLIKHNLNLPYFIFIGRLSLKKNLLGLIRSYNAFRKKINRPFNLILVGSETFNNHEIEEEIKNSPYGEEIKKMGWLPSADLPVLLSGAQAMVFPSIYEGFGLPSVEAMSCGCPVIASNSSALPEIISSAGLYADAHDVDGFADQMLKIIQDQNLRAELITKSLKRAEEFSWEKCAKQTLQLLEEI
jgi:glycosyltransferase involved in cell wall biosynthesis